MFAKILHRPALAIVISLIILFLGGLAIVTLPISQFPDVAPPSVVVAVSFPGASANVLIDSVLVILEQSINGVQDMRYMISDAFTEVINYLSKVEKYGQSIEIKKQQLDSLEGSVDSATKLFQNARAEYVEVLLAQRDLQDAKVVIIETKKQQLTAIVDAYQALGGGRVRSFNSPTAANQMR